MATTDVDNSNMNSNNASLYDDSWSHWEDSVMEEEPQESSSQLLFDAATPFLDTATMKRVSSCYLSLPSESSNNSLNELWTLWEDAAVVVNNKKTLPAATPTPTTDESSATTHSSTSDVLYHDILMNVFSFLDNKSLAAFSETAKRPNLECFSFLQLELQNALEENNNDDCMPQVANLRRLAQHDRLVAQDIVQEYTQSNTMDRRHVNYLRQLFLLSRPPPSPQALAALVLTLVAALNMTDHHHHTMIELSNMLFKVGFLGSLMGAAMSEGVNMRERAEQMAARLQEQLDDTSKGFFVRKIMQAAYDAAYGNQQNATHNNNNTTPFTPDDSSFNDEQDTNLLPLENHDAIRKIMPTGCVGDFSRAMARATNLMTQRIQQERRQKFQALSEEEQRQISSSFIDACCSDDSLDLVKELIQVRGTIDVEGFYVGSDGTETCGLHAAAFHGATQILEFLCQGLQDNDDNLDGGLCNVNLQDANGWSAVHFAAGANSVQVVRILASHGAALSVEASNGYTPLQWALRLQNDEVAQELRQCTDVANSWMSRAQPLSAIANRFLAMIPTTTSNHD